MPQRPDEDEKRRDEVLKRMLATPPKPHDAKAPKDEGKNVKKKKSPVVKPGS
ncbi:hypothetical protein [Bosea sp. PAMC 26642]|uniref:hypothetical protein n=1 Tax=Bosea sp. (strain PAMC 26642) TaxID=1792307 RepID=UPI000A987D0F|nr:hypothetical protein [Bosea sp. PAMC 26642]